MPVNPDPFPKNDPLNEPEAPRVVIKEPVIIKLPDIIADPVYGKVGVLDPPGAHDADTAQLDVPNNDPVSEVANILPLTCKVPDVGNVVPIPILPLLPEIVPPPEPNFILATV